MPSFTHKWTEKNREKRAKWLIRKVGRLAKEGKGAVITDKKGRVVAKVEPKKDKDKLS